MKFGILGTGMVGRAHAAKLVSLGHEVSIGTHDIEKTLAKTETDAMGNPPYGEWQKANPQVRLVTFKEAASEGEIIINALKGEVVLDELKKLDEELEGKILIDITNPLDFSKGMPPSLFISNTDSLGEQIQKLLPKTKVVKAFNTTNAFVQTDPQTLAAGDHHLFICGNDADAKAKVIEIAKSYGWNEIIDVGDISTARGTEMLLPIWVRLWGALQTPMFNFKIVK